MWGICGGSELTISVPSPEWVQMEKHEDVPEALAYLRYQVWAANLPASPQPMTNSSERISAEFVYKLDVLGVLRGSSCSQLSCYPTLLKIKTWNEMF